MKKILYFILFILLTVCVLFGCSKSNKLQTLNLTDKNAAACQNFLTQKGYSIVKYNGISESYKVTYEKLLSFPYDVRWGMQNIDPIKFIGKDAEIYSFVVKNHKLDNVQANNKKMTDIWVMMIDGQPLGGYSMPDYDEKVEGAGYSLDGRTIEQVTGKQLQAWADNWKYYIKSHEN